MEARHGGATRVQSSHSGTLLLEALAKWGAEGWNTLEASESNYINMALQRFFKKTVEGITYVHQITDESELNYYSSRTHGWTEVGVNEYLLLWKVLAALDPETVREGRTRKQKER